MGETGAESSEGKVSSPTEASHDFLNNWRGKAKLVLHHLVPPLAGAGIANILLTETYTGDARTLMAIGFGVGAGLFTLGNITNEAGLRKEVGSLKQKLKQRLINH